MRNWFRILVAGSVCAGSLSVTSLFAGPPEIQWEKTYDGGSGHWDEATSVQEIEGGYIIAGKVGMGTSTGGDIWLVKTDGKGDTLWTRRFGGTGYDAGYCVQTTFDGGCIISGTTTTPVGQQFYLVKTDSQGGLVWARIYGETEWGHAYSVLQTADSGYLAAGQAPDPTTRKYAVFLVKTNPNGDTIWTRRYGGVTAPDRARSVQETPDGYIVVGETESFGSGQSDIWLLKTDRSGDTVWTRVYGGTAQDKGYSVQPTPDGHYVTAGWTRSYGAGGCDVWLIKTDAGGNTVWAKTYGGPSNDCGLSVQVTSDSGYIISGWSIPDGAPAADAYLVRTDADGDTLWTKTFGDFDPTEKGVSVQLTSDGGYIVAGYRQIPGSFNPDAYLVKVGPDPVAVREPISPGEDSLCKALSVFRSEPNPFTDRALISYQPPGNGDVRITVYNLVGEEVRTLVSRERDSGLHTTTWDGRDETGKAVPGGIYFARAYLKGGNPEQCRIVLLR
ncbi:hypothetical protein CH330_05905 [candidate division WOR-3 bacterium JGI_Cruoil_03_51_56]|uniref:FlgD/Vpr Ig-like domain-containing protein n=1 Tax=candidate division WOR-3 bacterium JGI_Cruoil_03_51_56 TaxID=1973747 RepID=A0A235BUW1_UNCW3|nr:MAG: hypothetical protein CH330_05905 [candidate division WOR-3 bacterium JGI_Cruoil_03_51_56]